MSLGKQGESMAGPHGPVAGSAPQSMESLAGLIERAGHFRGPAPVHLWNPALCSTIDIVIDRDGRWHHEGELIRREALVRLFAGILRREADGDYALVTPAEKLLITVVDVPFLAVEMALAEGTILFRTNIGDVVPLDEAHPIRVETTAEGGIMPYIRVRGGLDARLTRAAALELIDRAVERDGTLAVESAGHFFVIAPADEAGSC